MFDCWFDFEPFCFTLISIPMQRLKLFDHNTYRDGIDQYCSVNRSMCHFIEECFSWLGTKHFFFFKQLAPKISISQGCITKSVYIPKCCVSKGALATKKIDHTVTILALKRPCILSSKMLSNECACLMKRRTHYNILLPFTIDWLRKWDFKRKGLYVGRDRDRFINVSILSPLIRINVIKIWHFLTELSTSARKKKKRTFHNM